MPKAKTNFECRLVSNTLYLKEPAFSPTLFFSWRNSKIPTFWGKFQKLKPPTLFK